MALVIREKFHISDLIPLEDEELTVVLVEPDWYLAKLYQRYLSAHNFVVHHSSQKENLEEDLHVILARVSPKVLIVNPDIFENSWRAAQMIAGVGASFPSIMIVSVGYDTPAEDLRELMGAGVVSHINRRSSRPKDVASIVKALIVK